ncbi:unnamed protein product [Coregonus sp. 'balchen']|nr:unnamed protein product [Coregonus sp. 'balchen']
MYTLAHLLLLAQILTCALISVSALVNAWVFCTLTLEAYYLRLIHCKCGFTAPIQMQDRSSKGGGVSIFTQEHLQCSVFSTKSVPKQFDLLVLSIKLSNSYLLTVAGCYRPPSAPACTLPAQSSLLAPYTKSEFVLLGDLNCDMLKLPVQVLKQWDSLNLSQIITNPTKYDSKHPEKATLLDVILTNNPDRYQSGVFCKALVITVLLPVFVMAAQ